MASSFQKLADVLSIENARMSGDPQRMQGAISSIQNRKATESDNLLNQQIDLMTLPDTQKALLKAMDLKTKYSTMFPSAREKSVERYSIIDRESGLPIGTVGKSDTQQISQIENDPRYLIAPLAGIPKDAAGSIEIKELVDENNIFIENIDEKDWAKRKEAGTLPPGSKLQNLGTGMRAADSGPERMDKAFAPIQEQFIAGEVLITGLSNTAKILAENPAIANDVVKGGAKVYSFIQSNVEGFDNLITRGQNSAVYNDVSKSKTSYDSKRNWSEEIDSLVSATGITESRIIDMAFALSAAKGQEGKGLSDRDFQNAIDMLSKGYNVGQKIDLFNDIAGRITNEFNIGRGVMISQNPALQAKYDALGDLSSFIDPRLQQTPPPTTGGPRRIRRPVPTE